MFGFLERDQPGRAAIYFPGGAPPPPGAFLRLRDASYRLTERRADRTLWAFELEHPTHGKADLWCDRDTPPLGDVIRYASNLSSAEKSAGEGAATSVQLRVPARRRNVLRDRKTMLRIARDLLGDDGVMVLDTASRLPWSRDALADELSHDADLDVEALYCLHSVRGDHADRPDWLHSHGLGELGAFDLDVVAPHPEFVANCGEPLRAIATMVLEGSVAADEDRFAFGHPGGEARLVPAARFMHEADPAFAALRASGHHEQRRSVLCEPAGRRLLGFGRGDRPEPLRLARGPVPERFVVYFPTATTDLMAERARATVGVLRAMTGEFAEFDVVAMVKLGYPTGGGGAEHLWFEVDAIGEATVSATLQNRPFAVDLQPGDRVERPLEAVTDWMLMTPAGSITPRSMSAARRLRDPAGEIRATMAGRPDAGG